MIEGIEIENGPRDPDHAPFRDGLSSIARSLGFDTFYLCVKFNDSSLNRSRDITGVRKIQRWSRDSDHTPFMGHFSSICWAFGTSHSLAVYKI